MKINERKLTGYLVICLVIIVSTYYVNSNFEINKKSNEINENEIIINLLIKENESSKWHNNTIVSHETSLFEITKEINEVDYSNSDYGKYVKSINGIKENKNTNQYWIWWIWNDKTGWIQGNLGSDQFKVDRNMTLAWTLSDMYKNEKP